MQRIYPDGKDNLSQIIPSDWEKPIKEMNHRSAKRIVMLINAIRYNVDRLQQKERTDAKVGTIRFFIASNACDKGKVEALVSKTMEKETNDEKWVQEGGYKSLILEHHMAASRLGFINLFSPIYSVNKFKSGVLDGNLPELRLFTQMVLPTIEALLSNNRFETAKLIKMYPPLLSKEVFINNSDSQLEKLHVVQLALDKLIKLWDNGTDPSCLEILSNIQDSGLFDVPERLQNVLYIEYSHDMEIEALKTAFQARFSEVIAYNEYISNQTNFATHQGVKGLEFPRVMVIIDDAEAKGNFFSYEKLFGAKDKTVTDIKN